jgi:hypothetical protein
MTPGALGLLLFKTRGRQDSKSFSSFALLRKVDADDSLPLR